MKMHLSCARLNTLFRILIFLAHVSLLEWHKPDSWTHLTTARCHYEMRCLLLREPARP